MQISEELESAASVKALLAELDAIKDQVHDMIGDAKSPYVKFVLDQLIVDCLRLKLKMIDASNELIGMHNAANEVPPSSN